MRSLEFKTQNELAKIYHHGKFLLKNKFKLKIIVHYKLLGYKVNYKFYLYNHILDYYFRTAIGIT